MGLAGPGGRGAVEEPQPARVPIHLGYRSPVRGPKPALLGLPLLGYHQHMASLDRVLVEQQQVA